MPGSNLLQQCCKSEEGFFELSGTAIEYKSETVNIDTEKMKHAQRRRVWNRGWIEEG